jgi:hypothetical protein
MDSKIGPIPEDSPGTRTPEYDEKKALDIEIDAVDSHDNDGANSATKIYIPGGDEEFIDPKLNDYPIPLVA